MRATDHLQAAHILGLRNFPELHKQWNDVALTFGDRYGMAHCLALNYNGRLDLLLRQLEAERLQQAQAQDAPDDMDWSLDLFIGLSESWILRAYEVVRAVHAQMRERGQVGDKIKALKYRLGLVRMPIAKASIQGDKDLKQPLILRNTEGTDPTPYATDGSYTVPRGTCGETGAIVWWPVDSRKKRTVVVCRHDLSNEFLALLD